MHSAGNSQHSQEPSGSKRTPEFVELYSQHYQRLHYYLMALLPTSTDAADVMQETSLVLWKKFDSFESGTNFLAWACKTARLQAMKHYQRSSRTAKLFDVGVMEKIAAEAMTPLERPAVPLEVLEKCLGVLSAKDRTLIKRRYEDDTTVKQIARELGRSANSLSQSLGRIRRCLLACVERKLSQEW